MAKANDGVQRFTSAERVALLRDAGYEGDVITAFEREAADVRRSRELYQSSEMKLLRKKRRQCKAKAAQARTALMARVVARPNAVPPSGVTTLPQTPALRIEVEGTTLHAETTELLRLVKTPASVPVPSPSRRQGGAGSVSKTQVSATPARLTIEVLEEDEDEQGDDGIPPMERSSAPRTPASREGGTVRGAPTTTDFSFEAEELRVRRAVDTFVPDTSPSKRSMESQRSHLSAEQQRLESIRRREGQQIEKRRMEFESKEVVNRVEQSAVKISLQSERLEDDMVNTSVDFSRGRQSSLPPDDSRQHSNVANDNSDWQVNDSLFLADGSKNSKLRDTIRNALQVSKFDSISSLIASNVVLRKKLVKGRRRSREIVLGKREMPMFVAVLTDQRAGGGASPGAKVRGKRKAVKKDNDASSHPLAMPPRIRDLVDPGFHENLQGPSSESALMCSNWDLDQLRRKYRAEEIQEIFMKQNASLRYDKRLKQYVTVIEKRHPIYRLADQLVTSWNKTMRRKLHTRAWFRSFIEQLRAGRVPKADASTPKLMKLKNTIQNHRWCTSYSDTVREFHPKAPVTAKNQSGQRPPILDVIMVNPAHPQLRFWVIKTDCTKPVELYKPRRYEVPPRRCVPMPTPSFLEDIPLPVPNIHIACGHIASWFERLSSRIGAAAINKALLQILACTPPRGVTDARRTKHVTPVTVMFATFGRKPTPGNLAVGGLTAELLIHMLVTTYIPAQYGHFIVFDRRAIAPTLTKDFSARYLCLVIDPTTMPYVFRALEHALNVRRPPTVTIATRVAPGELDEVARQRFPRNRPEQTGEEAANGFRTFWLVDAFAVPDDVASVSVQPTADVLSPNSTSMNPTMTTKADRFYPFCIPTTKENTPIEYIHLLWIGQSSRNQPQTFTSLGAQQPGEFMKNSNPDGALGPCTSVIYRSWAYMQSSPYEEFTTEDGIAYWYDKQSGETFWTRPILPIEKFRGKDGEMDGVVTDGDGETATLGVGVDAARYTQQELRKYMTKRMEAPEERERRLNHVGASARKHEITISLAEPDRSPSSPQRKKDFARIEVPKLHFEKRKPTSKGRKSSSTAPPPGQARAEAVVTSSPTKAMATAAHVREPSVSKAAPVDAGTKQLIETITQALGSALPALSQGHSGADMLQLGIGLGMGLGLRAQQQQQTQQVRPPSALKSASSGRPRSANVSFGASTEDNDDSGGDEDDGADELSTTRSDVSSGSTDASLLTARSTVSAASVDITPSPDEIELLPESEKAKLRVPAGYGQKVPGYKTHPPPGEGRTWIDKPIDSSAASQTAVNGHGGAVHQRVACLPKGFVEAVSSTKTCKMQANYLPVINNINQPRSVGIVRPRPALDEWVSMGYSPWSAGRSVFSTQFIGNLMQRLELIAQEKANAGAAARGGATGGAPVQIEKKENVTQAVKEAQQLETVFSLCRHGKYDELEKMITSPDWTLPIDAKDVTGNTLLSIACQNNNKRIAKLCLRRGADINTQNLNGQSVLHYCHEYGFHDLMEYLVEKGARDDLLNADGLTCYEGLTKEAVDSL
ncbi:hypothetical protein ATCC90586_006528 [Pythium insidiosum]|nr:hypothetical protein ATCC90586_006528 [Pythium insidiosum]